jgi:hypothetical protein
LHANSTIDCDTVIELCDFSAVPIVTNNNLLYNIQISDDEWQKYQSENANNAESDESIKCVTFPANHLIYSVPVEHGPDHEIGCCTIACPIKCEIKSLWDKKIFPICENNVQSLIATLKVLEQSSTWCVEPLKDPSDVAQSVTRKCLSMSEVFHCKNVPHIISQQMNIKQMYHASSIKSTK